MSTRRHRQKAQSRYAQLRACREVARHRLGHAGGTVALLQGRRHGLVRFDIIAPAPNAQTPWTLNQLSGDVDLVRLGELLGMERVAIAGLLRIRAVR